MIEDQFNSPAFRRAIERLRAYEQRLEREQVKEISTMNNETNQTRLDSATLQAKYDQAYRCSTGAAAPPRVFGEAIETYERRLIAPLQKHSTKFASPDLNKIGDMTALRALAEDIRADAIKVSLKNEGPLRSYQETDGGGRTLTKWVGAPGACWDRFKLPYRFVKKFGNEQVF